MSETYWRMRELELRTNASRAADEYIRLEYPNESAALLLGQFSVPARARRRSLLRSAATWVSLLVTRSRPPKPR
jgi:hypothetical protein